MKKIYISLFFVFILSTGFCQEKGKKEIVAKINNTSIPSEYFNAIYERFLQDFRAYNPGSSLDKETVTWAKRYVMDEIIKRELMLQEARRMKFDVSNAEIEKKIKEDPSFKGKDGKFDRTKYLWAINNPKINWKQIRDSIREELLYPKFQEYIMNREKISDKEVREEYIKRNEKMKIQYIIVKSVTLSDTEIFDTEVETYFKQHQENYRVPQKVKAKYILITPENVQEDTVTFEEIKSYYEKHRDEFQEPERARVRHIMIGIPQDADTKTVEEKRKSAEEILKKLKAGEDFATLAQKYSQDTRTAGQGGDMGYLKMGAINKELENIIFPLKPGEISKVEKAPFGFHIFKVEQRKPAGIADFEEAKDRIRNEIARERKKIKARQLSEDILKKVKSIQEFETESTPYGRVIETPYFSQNDSLDTIGYNLEFNRSCFALKPGEIDTKVITLEWRPGKLIGFAILGVVDKADTYIPLLKDVIGNVRNDCKREKAKNITSEKVEEIKTKLKDSTEFETTALKFGYTSKEITFNRFQFYIEGIGYVPDLVKTSFDSAPQELRTVNVPEGICLYKAIEKIGIDEGAFVKERENLKKSLTYQKNSQAFEKWYQELKSRSKITVYLEGYSEK